MSPSFSVGQILRYDACNMKKSSKTLNTLQHYIHLILATEPYQKEEYDKPHTCNKKRKRANLTC